jgi:hypothetical protein
MEEVTMENRAWRGVRLVSKPIREGQKEYVYTIGWHTSRVEGTARQTRPNITSLFLGVFC